jgi:Transposase DDE domain
MPTLAHVAYQKFISEWINNHKHEPDVASSLEYLADALALLWHLDLEPAREVLQQCWAANSRGGEPWDPVVKLRSLLLSIILGQTSINKWAKDLKGSRILRLLAGLTQDLERRQQASPGKAVLGVRPGVGTFYDFLHRLHDGPIRGCCEHIERPSENERRRVKTPKVLKKKEKKPKKEKKKRGRPLKNEARPVEDSWGVTRKLVAQLGQAKELPNPNDLLQRLSIILLEVAIKESGAKGLLGDVHKLTLGGDGSMLRTGASPWGRRICGHSFNEKCSCPRLYSDPDAEWGWNSHRKIYFYGHHFYEISSSVSGRDLPIALGLESGNGSDFTASLNAFDRLQKNLAEYSKGWQIGTFIADAGHDSEPIFRYLLDHGASPVIPLKTDAPAVHPQHPNVKLSKRGVPVCEGGVEMAPWGSSGNGRSGFICPLRRNLERCPLAPKGSKNWHCRPDLHWGPTATIKTLSNPRLCPPISRNSAQYLELYNLRSGTERSNSVKKETFKLEAARHRRASFWMIRLHLIAILQHAKAWVADGKAMDLVDSLLGRRDQAFAA